LLIESVQIIFQLTNELEDQEPKIRFFLFDEVQLLSPEREFESTILTFVIAKKRC
jgi:hypothetical protein